MKFLNLRDRAIKYTQVIAVSVLVAGCGGNDEPKENTEVKETSKSQADVRLLTLDPGHFHAALVQKKMYPGIDTTVYVYAPGGAELDAHLALINQYRERSEDPATWKEVVYTGTDFFNKMLAEKKGNVVVLAGNNRRKTEFIQQSVEAGLNVLGDKPMAINDGDFSMLVKSFETAAAKKVLLYDIMTERSEITNILQKEFAGIPEVFGELTKGSAADPSILMESVHYYSKLVSGKVLTRPTWFFDPTQQGEAIPDVGTHLVDLVQWEYFPDQTIDYNKDLVLGKSKIWFTPLTLSQFASVTKKDSFPAFLKKYVVKDSVIETHGNGEINYEIKGIHARVIARWDYQAKEGGDTHYSLVKGSRAQIIIRQGKDEKFLPTLYIIPVRAGAAFDTAIAAAVQKLNGTYAGITAEKSGRGYRINIPDSFKVGHEAHFGQVMERYLAYLKKGGLPAWEVPNMLAKYYITTQSFKTAALTTK
ncbi:MAG: oxidoreductase [Chitinophagaceae bacterium]|nr:MAG: oxidoreductase [Chitinophagaceae bacterium]